MNKYFTFAFILILLGAGCQTRVDQAELPVDPNRQPESTEVVVEPIEEPVESRGPGVASVTVLDPASKTVEMTTGNYFFKPASIAVETGQTVVVKFLQNTGEHTFVIDELDLRHQVQGGEELTFIAPEEAGMYYFYCDIGDHRERGMEGVLHVKEL